MNLFDKCCAALAAAVAVFLIVLGVLGLFVGCHGGFTLPPVLGVLPFFVGWGIIRSVIIAWRAPRPPSSQFQQSALNDPPQQLPPQP